MTQRQPEAGASAADLLMQHRETLARHVTDALYLERPELIAKHGERGREKCLQDMRYNIDHLIPAVDLGSADMFTRYVHWLDGMLSARNVATGDVIRCLELLADACMARLPASQATSIVSIIRTGMAGLSS